MDDQYKNFNEQKYAAHLQILDREIAEAERLADQEHIQEITDGVLKNLSTDGSKAMNDIASELQKALNGIKL